jgi:molybdate transport system ATP-binding protein
MNSEMNMNTNQLSINLHLTKGEFQLKANIELQNVGVTAIYGPSGSGKTTLLRSIAGLENPQGFCKFNNEVWLDQGLQVPTFKRPIAYIFQESNLFDHMTVEKNLLFGSKRRQKIYSKITFDHIVEVLQIQHLLFRTPSELSGGEKQKVAIGRALLSHPQLLLMDEPLSMIDEGSKKQILNHLETIFKEFNIPTLYVTHSKNEVLQLAKSLILIENGNIKAQGKLEFILTDSSLPFLHEKDAVVSIPTTSLNSDIDSGITKLQFSGGVFLAPFQEIKQGTSVGLKISARDVSLCLERPINTSILNIFPAKVTEVNLEGHSQATITLDVGGATVLSKISQKSLQNLNIVKGTKLYAQIKAVALV